MNVILKIVPENRLLKLNQTDVNLLLVKINCESSFFLLYFRLCVRVRVYARICVFVFVCICVILLWLKLSVAHNKL